MSGAPGLPGQPGSGRWQQTLKTSLGYLFSVLCVDVLKALFINCVAVMMQSSEMIIKMGMSHFPKECDLLHSTYSWSWRRQVLVALKTPCLWLWAGAMSLHLLGSHHPGPPRGLILFGDEALLPLHFILSVTAVVYVCEVPMAQLSAVPHRQNT